MQNIVVCMRVFQFNDMMKIITKIIIKFIKFYIETMIVYSFLTILSSGAEKVEKTTKNKLKYDIGQDF